MTGEPLAGALEHAAAGYRVGPVTITDLNGRKTATFHTTWRDPNGTSSDPAQLAAWDREHPGCGWHAPTELNGVVVVDQDVKRTRDGIRSGARAWRRAGGPTSPMTVNTANGGRHLYFRAPTDPIGNSVGAIEGVELVDVRGLGGTVFITGTLVRGGGRYSADRVLPVNQLPDLDDTWADRLRRAHRGTQGREVPTEPGGTVAEHDVPWLEATASRMLDELAAPGGTGFRGRLYGTAALLFRLVDHGQITDHEAREALTDAVRSAWGANPDAEDRRWIDDARAEARARPWELVAHPDHPTRDDVAALIAPAAAAPSLPPNDPQTELDDDHPTRADVAALIAAPAPTPPPAAPALEAPPAPDTPDAQGDDATTLAERTHNYEVATEAKRLRVRRDATRALADEEHALTFRVPPHRPTLTDELAIPDEPVTYTVDQLVPTGANVLLTAGFKTGKTTLVANLVRSLADRDPFLGEHTITDTPGRVALFNYEVDERQHRRWLRDIGVTNTDAVSVLNLRGYRLPLMVPRVEEWVVEWLVTNNISTWIVDPFARAAVGSVTNENDNTEVGAFLDTLDVIKDKAGVRDLIMPTHTGRGEMEEGAERARGATRLDDWADVRWLLTKGDDDVRYFRATGRDVDTEERALRYRAITRTLEYGDTPDKPKSRSRARVGKVDDAVLRAIEATPGVSTRELRGKVRAEAGKTANAAVDEAVDRLVELRRVRLEVGGGPNPTRHFPVPPGAGVVPQ